MPNLFKRINIKIPVVPNMKISDGFTQPLMWIIAGAIWQIFANKYKEIRQNENKNVYAYTYGQYLFAFRNTYDLWPSDNCLLIVHWINRHETDNFKRI